MINVLYSFERGSELEYKYIFHILVSYEDKLAKVNRVLMSNVSQNSSMKAINPDIKTSSSKLEDPI